MTAHRKIDVWTRMAAVMASLLTVAFWARAEMIVESGWESDLEGWTVSGSASVASVAGSIKTTFPEQTAPEHSSVMLTKSVAPRYRPYRVAFRFKAPVVVPSALRVYIKSTSGRSWYKPFDVPETGEWLDLNALVSYESGWILGPRSDRHDFESDMNSISEVSVLLVRNGTSKQHSFQIDDFVVDAIPSGGKLPSDSDGDGMSDSWEVANSLDAADPNDAQYDDDADGLKNVEEYLAGTDPKDPSSTFEVAIESAESEGAPDGFMLMWASAADRYYQVWRSTNLLSGFDMLQGGITATPPVNVYVDFDTPVRGSFFYRIELE